MLAAAETVYNFAEGEKNKLIRQIDVSFDRTYMTHGHTSRVGVGTLTGYETGKALDTDSKSKSYQSCDYWNKKNKSTQRYRDWQAKHGNNCTMTHEGSSGSMESDMAV